MERDYFLHIQAWLAQGKVSEGKYKFIKPRFIIK